jgi:hypothetical protein
LKIVADAKTVAEFVAGGGKETAFLRCPVCRLQFNHVGEVFTRLGRDENEADAYKELPTKKWVPRNAGAPSISLGNILMRRDAAFWTRNRQLSTGP